VNPIRNAVELASERKLISCKRCGCPRLAWVQLKSQRWVLCETSYKRPFYTGDNQTPEAQPGMVYANKTRIHNCAAHALSNTRYAVEADLSQALPKALEGFTDVAAQLYAIGQNKRIKDAANTAVDFFFSEVLKGRP